MPVLSVKIILLHKVFIAFEFMDEIQLFDHSNV